MICSLYPPISFPHNWFDSSCLPQNSHHLAPQLTVNLFTPPCSFLVLFCHSEFVNTLPAVNPATTTSFFQKCLCQSPQFSLSICYLILYPHLPYCHWLLCSMCSLYSLLLLDKTGLHPCPPTPYLSCCYPWFCLHSSLLPPRKEPLFLPRLGE